MNGPQDSPEPLPAPDGRLLGDRDGFSAPEQSRPAYGGSPQLDAQPDGDPGALPGRTRRAQRRPRPAAVIAAVTALIVLASAGWTVAQWPEMPASGAAADFAVLDPEAPWAPDWVPDSVRYPQAWSSMNEALREHDRERFLSYAEGDARDRLALWWDNTALIGRGTGFIVPAIGSDGEEGAFLGAELAFSSRPLRGSGDTDAGYRLTQGFAYDIVTTGTGEDLRITSFTPVNPMPWDEGPLYAATRDHVVLYGMADERALVDASIDEAERGAVLAITTVTDLGGRVPMTGFVSGITDDEERMRRWQFGDDAPEGEPWIAGYATATNRPSLRSDLFDSDIAVGRTSSGVLVMLGPLSADQRLSTFTHEFSHGLHYAAAPLTADRAAQTAVYEGFATYIELRAGTTDIRWLRDRRLTRLIASKGAEALSEEAFAGEDAWLSYLAAGSYYLFVAENGGDPWKLALDGAEAAEDENLIRIADDPRFSEERWQAWIARR